VVLRMNQETNLSYTKFVFASDVHIPHEDKRALKILHDFRRDFKPDRFIVGGDLLSADQVSSFPNNCHVDLSDEFDQANFYLDQWKPTDFLMGNHEERLSRVGLVKENMLKMLDPVKHLKLKERKVKYLPYDSERPLVIGKLKFVHGFYASEYAAKKHADIYGNVVFGHTHRIQSFQAKTTATNHSTGFNTGCLCKLRLPYITTNGPTRWGLGFGFGYVKKNGNFSMYLARIINNKVIINDKEYIG